MIKFGPIALLLVVFASASLRAALSGPIPAASPEVPGCGRPQVSPQASFSAFVAPAADQASPDEPPRTAESPLVPAPPQAATEGAKEEIGKLFQSGISEEILMAYVRARGRPTSFSADDLVELKRLGLSDRLLAFLAGSPVLWAPASPDDSWSPVWPGEFSVERLASGTMPIPLEAPLQGSYAPDFPGMWIPYTLGGDPEAPAEPRPGEARSWDVLTDVPTILFVSDGVCRCGAPGGVHRPPRRPVPAMGPSRFPAARPGTGAAQGAGGTPLSVSASGRPGFLPGTAGSVPITSPGAPAHGSSGAWRAPSAAVSGASGAAVPATSAPIPSPGQGAGSAGRDSKIR